MTYLQCNKTKQNRTCDSRVTDGENSVKREIKILEGKREGNDLERSVDDERKAGIVLEPAYVYARGDPKER